MTIIQIAEKGVFKRSETVKGFWLLFFDLIHNKLTNLGLGQILNK